jgi:hypothetical protein
MYTERPRVDWQEKRRGAVYMADRIGDRGEPWGIPWDREKGSERNSLTWMWTWRSTKKERSHAHSSGGKPNSAKR